jgi:hypothetical protein
MERLTYAKQRDQKWLDYIKPKFYKHLCKNVFKTKSVEAMPNFENLANEYMTRRKQENKRVTYIFLVVELFQWMINNPRRKSETIDYDWDSNNKKVLYRSSDKNSKDKEIKMDKELDLDGVCLTKHQIAYILNISKNTVKWCIKALYNRNMGRYDKRDLGVDKNGNKTIHHIKTMQWKFLWVKEIVTKLKQKLHTLLQEFHFRFIEYFYWQPKPNLNTRE